MARSLLTGRRGRGLIRVLVVAALSVLLPAAGRAADAARGADLFDNYCSECHTTRAGGGSRSAPNLFELMGRRTGAVEGFAYSDANRNAGWVWSPDTLDPYLTAPKTAMPGTVMKFQGVKDPGERADLIAFLATLHK
ncbi:c-type cytochrome [Nitrospirillum iridis]|uniref:Cytochrome c n=1 Tax=Nitrospirillum iridis TaxID=765888 RepID=A0A7X0AWQ5_9PROT|nr:c-type cytochrome [Nitrospirillum iridis]MBB6251527.1 cytochrome c [Nitrospirillum iridis]